MDNLNGVPPSLQVEAGDYITIHYGPSANDDQSLGGGLIAYYSDSSQTFTPDANGPGSNGHGPILLVDVWDHTGNTVPDGGAATVLLAGELAGVGAFVRSRKTGLS